MSARPRNSALDRLVAEGVITQEQAAAVRDALDAEPMRRPRVRWAEVTGYLGGGLVLAGAAALVAQSWDDLARAAQVSLLVSLTAGLIAVAVVVAGGPAVLRLRTAPPTRARLSAVLLTLASGTAALAAGVAAGSHEAAVSGTAGLVVATAGYMLVPSVLGVLACGLFSSIAAGALADDISGSSLAVGVTLIALGAVWIMLAARAVLPHRVPGFGVGATVALFGGQMPLGQQHAAPWAYALTFGVALACLALYWRERTWVLLVAGVIGVTIAVPEAIWDWTDGAVGGALIMIVAGAVLVAASVTGLKLHRLGPPGQPKL